MHFFNSWKRFAFNNILNMIFTFIPISFVKWKKIKIFRVLKNIFCMFCSCGQNCACVLAPKSKQFRQMSSKSLHKLPDYCLIWDIWILIHVRINKKNQCRNVTLRHRISFPVYTSEDQASFKTERSISEKFCAFICQNFLALFLNLAH